MRNVKSCLPVLAIFAAVGCKETPERAWKEMHSAACEGDVPRFFSRVDKSAITKRLRGKVEEKLDAEKAPGGVIREMALNVAEKEIDKAFTEWEDDIIKRESGDWCRARPLDEERESGVMHWSTPSGRQKSARFANYSGHLVMVELLD